MKAKTKRGVIAWLKQLMPFWPTPLKIELEQIQSAVPLKQFLHDSKLAGKVIVMLPPPNLAMPIGGGKYAPLVLTGLLHPACRRRYAEIAARN